MRVWETATGVSSSDNQDSSFPFILRRNKWASVTDTYPWSTPPGYQGVPVDNEEGVIYDRNFDFLSTEGVCLVWIYLPDTFFWFIYWVEHWK